MSIEELYIKAKYNWLESEEYRDDKASEYVKIKSKKDLKEKLQAGINDIEANKVYSLSEALTKIDNIQNWRDIMKKIYCGNFWSCYWRFGKHYLIF